MVAKCNLAFGDRRLVFDAVGEPYKCWTSVSPVLICSSTLGWKVRIGSKRGRNVVFLCTAILGGRSLWRGWALGWEEIGHLEVPQVFVWAPCPSLPQSICCLISVRWTANLWACAHLCGGHFGVQTIGLLERCFWKTVRCWWALLCHTSHALFLLFVRQVSLWNAL